MWKSCTPLLSSAWMKLWWWSSCQWAGEVREVRGAVAAAGGRGAFCLSTCSSPPAASGPTSDTGVMDIPLERGTRRQGAGCALFVCPFPRFEPPRPQLAASLKEYAVQRVQLFSIV